MDLALTPFWQDLLFCLLTLWPAFIVLRRMGLRLYLAGLVFGSLLLPFFGHMLLLGYIALSRWPHLPMPAKPKKRSR